jgi:hypothetical protein
MMMKGGEGRRQRDEKDAVEIEYRTEAAEEKEPEQRERLAPEDEQELGNVVGGERHWKESNQDLVGRRFGDGRFDGSVRVALLLL